MKGLDVNANYLKRIDAMKGLNTRNEIKVNYLVDLGFEVDSFDNETISFTDEDGYGYEISFDNFEVGDSPGAITENADLYSPCCAELVDRDYMRCPGCKESV